MCLNRVENCKALLLMSTVALIHVRFYKDGVLIRVKCVHTTAHAEYISGSDFDCARVIVTRIVAPLSERWRENENSLAKAMNAGF